MKTNTSITLNFSHILILALMLPYTWAFGQDPEWINYRGTDRITELASEGEIVWVATLGGGLVRIDQESGETSLITSANSGLPDNLVESIAIDSDGTKWIGTCSGLAALNGESWTVYDTSNSDLSNNWVLSITVDDNDIKWIGTDGGITSFDGSEWNTYTVPNQNEVSSITVDSSGVVWLITWIRIGSMFMQPLSSSGPLYSFDDGVWTEHFEDEPWEDWVTAFSSIAIDSNGVKWVGNLSRGLFAYNDSSWTVYDTSNSDLPDNYVNAIAIDNSGTRWIGTGSGLTSSSDTDWNVYESAIPGIFYDISFDDSENVWLTNGQMSGGFGVVSFDGSNWFTHETSNSGLSSNNVLAILNDDSGTKWIGTGSGLNSFDGSNWEEYTTINSPLLSNSVMSIEIESNGTKWLGTPDGLNSFDGSSWTGYSESNSLLPSDFVPSIAIDSDDTKWIGTGGGLVSIVGDNWTTYTVNNSGLLGQNVHNLAVDNNGIIWMEVSVPSRGLASFDGSSWILYTTSNSSLPDNAINSIAIDSDGAKWIGTEEGLATFDGINWVVYDDSNSDLPNNWVTYVGIDDSGTKWIGTHSGFASFDGISWTIYDEFNSDISYSLVNSIAFDENGNKWIGTSGDGLFVFNEGGLVLAIDDDQNRNVQLTDFILNQNYPNPFNPSTTINYKLPEASPVSLVIYDVMGREVGRLVNTQQPAGWYQLEWHGDNQYGKQVATGMYFARLQAGDYSKVIKMVYLR